MARKTDNKAARARKQKIFLAIGGVVLAALAVIQGPKLLDQLKGSSPAAPAASASSTPTPAATGTEGAAPTNGAAAPVATVATVRAPKSATTQLAGIVIVPEQPAKAGDGQLQSFTLFDSKDPFVQKVTVKLLTPEQVAQLGVKQSAPAAKPGVPTGSGSTGGSATGGGSAAGGSTSAPQPVATPLTIAILKVNGVLQTIELGKRFPKGDPAFVLKSLKRGRVGIAVAGGDFAGGGVLTLRLGRQITLVNTATGARYVVKLLYIGDESQVTRFSSK
jgi:hypothetical protein